MEGWVPSTDTVFQVSVTLAKGLRILYADGTVMSPSNFLKEKHHMKVYVIGLNGIGLMPTTPRKARKLLKA